MEKNAPKTDSNLVLSLLGGYQYQYAFGEETMDLSRFLVFVQRIIFVKRMFRGIMKRFGLKRFGFSI